MHVVIQLLVLGCACAAHYTGFDSRDLIIREEPADEDGTLVECPVCENVLSFLPSHEECPIIRGNKKYKKCLKGTYINEVCGNRLDCYRGPREQCTENMNFDAYGQKCAHGYYCDNTFHVCTGSDFAIESKYHWLIHPGYRFPLNSINHDRPEMKSMILA
ncbi:uncharacterized protein LOC121725996 [Aricia agestis]|uniref:uncharacterized protein LOC121725996 n=1 Tax=Aricia agestis TaxID=91739 RepID=UPI001C201E7E|nr:uncharacterized protein LOC121725996 [Aricia agestis]